MLSKMPDKEIPYNSDPIHSETQQKKTIEEELAAIKQMPFKFGCLGINCLGWLIIFTIILVVYLIWR